MTLILICVLGLAPGNPGVSKIHVLTPSEQARVDSFSVDDSCDSDECQAKELDRARAMRNQMCKQAFGKTPDLSWFEGRKALKAVRS